MKNIKVAFVLIAVLAACTMATSAWSLDGYYYGGLSSGAFGSPDPTTGSMVMGWFRCTGAARRGRR